MVRCLALVLLGLTGCSLFADTSSLLGGNSGPDAGDPTDAAPETGTALPDAASSDSGASAPLVVGIGQGDLAGAGTLMVGIPQATRPGDQLLLGLCTTYTGANGGGLPMPNGWIPHEALAQTALARWMHHTAAEGDTTMLSLTIPWGFKTTALLVVLRGVGLPESYKGTSFAAPPYAHPGITTGARSLLVASYCSPAATGAVWTAPAGMQLVADTGTMASFFEVREAVGSTATRVATCSKPGVGFADLSSFPLR